MIYLLAVVSLFCFYPANLAAAQEPLVSRHEIVGGQFQYKVQKGDSLTGIGARFGVDAAVLARENRLDPKAWLKINQRLEIDNRHIVPRVLENGILINLPQRMLFYFAEGKLAAHYPIGLGRSNWQTPTGTFTIRTKEEDPIWDVPPSIQEEMRREGKPVLTQVPACSENPLGKHWMGLSIAGYGVHGTIAPTSIYQFQTHGCIRLHPDDVANLFAAAAVGTPGLIIYERLMIARAGDRIFLEAHRDIYGKESNAMESLENAMRQEGLDGLIDWKEAQVIIARQEGIARELTRRPLH